MEEELNLDIQSRSVYVSTRLIQHGIELWNSLLLEAIQHHNDDWLANQLQTMGCLKSHEQRVRNGIPHLAKVPFTAAETLAEGEFNRFYARGVCVRAIHENIPEIEVYRGKEVQRPRYESEIKIGKRFSPKLLLNDLRTSQGVEPALGIPPGPNSGITIRIPK
ncbi:MAG: hypothetical protein NTV10_00205 [Methanoregula sp.]|nr:hypothetical protein [Methanoregula sp.]